MILGMSGPLSWAITQQAAARGGGGGYEAEATALFARFSTDPGTTRKNAINTCIASLKSAGVWTKLEALWVFAAHEEASALLNWVSTSHNLTKTGAPTFTTDQGFLGVAGTGYLVTPDNLTTYTLFTQNSAHIAAWVRGTGQSTAASFVPDDLVTTGTNMFARYSDDSVYLRVNDNAESSAITTVATAAGFLIGNRSGANAREAYKNGASLGTYGSVASKAVSAQPYRWAYDTVNQLSAASIGGSLNNTEQLAFYNAMNTLKTAVGW